MNSAFIFSMPRAGSTLLSLLLDNHSEIHCPPEPWMQLLLAELCVSPEGLQLPFDKNKATLAAGELIRSASEFPESGVRLAKAFRDLFSVQDREDGAKQFTDTVYGVCLSQTGKRIFVDKTPRYYHILDFLDRVYPAAKKILLKRNPMDIALSYKTTWGISVDEMIGRVSTPNTVDFAKGLYELERYASSQRPDIFVVAYEELVSDPQSCLSQLCGYLGVEFSPTMLDFYKNPDVLAARKKSVVGDRKVLSAGRGVDKASLGKWRTGLSFDEKSQLAAFLGKDVFEKLGYRQTIRDLAEDGVEFLPENESEALRSAALATCELAPEVASQTGQLAYLAACTGVGASDLGMVIELLVQHLRGEMPLHDQLGELVLDIVRLYQLSERDSHSLSELTAALKAAGEERTAHLQALDELTATLKAVGEERTAHLQALDELTAALKAAGELRVAHLQALDELTAALCAAREVLNRRPIRIAMRLFGIELPLPGQEPGNLQNTHN